MIKKLIVLLGSMLFTVSVFAAAVQMRDGHPDTYTVRKGDTLWGISSRFLKKPWLWPEIWQANPQVRNPHLIYPGDILNLSMDGRGGPHLGLQPRVREEGEAITAIPLKELQTFLKDTRVMDSNEVSDLPYVMGFEENRLRAGPGQKVYVRGDLQGEPGQRWAIARPTHAFRGFKDEGDGIIGPLVADPLDSNVAMNNGPWREDFNDNGQYGRGDDLGVEVTIIGTAETLKMGDPATLLVVDSTKEIRSGDRLVPIDDHPYDATYFPHAPKNMPKDGKVIAFTDSLDAVGRSQVVALSVGSRDGVDNGTTFTVMTKGESVSDDVAHGSWIRGSGRSVKLPDEFGGHVMVFRTFEKVSYALVMDGTKPLHKGDTLVAPE